MKVALCLVAIFGALVARKARELERVWLGEASIPPRADRHVLE
jgi:hypothetical protein